MKLLDKMVYGLLCSFLLTSVAFGQQKRSAAESAALQARYGNNYEEIVQKYGDNPFLMQQAADDHLAALNRRPFFFERTQSNHYVVRSEAEPNDFFPTADAIDDVLSTPNWRGGEGFTGGLISATFTEGDFDVYKFTVDTTKMYYFAGTHSFPGTENFDDGSLGVNMNLFHESDLDTTYVEGFNGEAGNDQIRGDIQGETTNHRANSGDFRLTGWVSPIDPATNEKLTGDFYLFIYNGEGGGSQSPIKSLGGTGTYHFSAFAVDIATFVDKAEPNQTFQEALLNSDAVLPADGVVRSYMGFNPDTVKIVRPNGNDTDLLPRQANSVHPQLLAQGDEDVDHFRLDGLMAGHTLVLETLPFFGYYRDVDGSMGPGNTRWTDPRIRLYNADYTTILREDDDAGREVQSTDGQPNNIHSRIVYDVQEADEGAPMWLWVSGWASRTRDPGQSVDNRDPGRYMYKVYAYQYRNDNLEAEPNGTAAEATAIAARADTVVTGAFADGSDEDYYRVFMHSQRMYSIFSQNSTVSDDIQVEIYREFESDAAGTIDITGNLLTDPVAGNAGNNDFLISGYIPEESGAYLLKLSSASAGDYQLGVVDKGTVFGGLVANEPDNEAADALTQDALEIGPGALARTAAIYPASDVDHYHFNLSEGFELTLTIGGSQDIVDDFDVQVTLLDPDGNEIETSSDGISYTAAASGQYIAQVTAVNDGDVGFYTISGGEPFIETEPNNAFETANTIALGNIYESALSEGDVDFYSFTLEAGNLYSFRSLQNGTGAGLTVGFFDELNGETIMDDSGWPTNYGSDTDEFKIANIIPRETKTYYLSVSGAAGPYKITSRINEDYYALQSKGEPNNNKTEADANGSYQSFGGDVMYVLSNPIHPRFFGDEDWFRVDMLAGQTITAETKPVGGDDWNKDTDTRIVILGADGTTELANDDDGGNEWYSLATATAAEDGPVYVQVRTSRTPDSADDRSMNRGDYWLNIDVTSAEAEPNNTFADANTLAGGFIESSLETGVDDVDVFAINMEIDNIYHVRTIKPDEGGFSGGFSAKLFKASDTATNLLSETQTGYNTRYSGSNVKLNIIPDESGVYYLELTATEGAGAYSVGVKSNDIAELKTDGEPNNTPEEADAIGAQEFDMPGVPRTSMLFNPDFPWTEGDQITARYGDDIDIYRYDLVAGDTIVAETSPVDGPLWPRDYDGFMEMYTSTDTLTNDDGGFDWHSKITHIAEVDETVYVLVRSQDFGTGDDRDPSRGEYNLTVTKMDGTPIIIPVNTESDETPNKFALDQNYPNPFNPVTTISYSIPEALDVELTVYNVLGQQVATLVSGFQTAGSHLVQFDATHLASGMYLYRIKAGNNVSVKKMLLVK